MRRDRKNRGDTPWRRGELSEHKRSGRLPGRGDMAGIESLMMARTEPDTYSSGRVSGKRRKWRTQ